MNLIEIGALEGPVVAHGDPEAIPQQRGIGLPAVDIGVGEGVEE
jgi:hypothetical protein